VPLLAFILLGFIPIAEVRPPKLKWIARHRRLGAGFQPGPTPPSTHASTAS
jgi:hypothetical protein